MDNSAEQAGKNPRGAAVYVAVRAIAAVVAVAVVLWAMTMVIGRVDRLQLSQSASRTDRTTIPLLDQTANHASAAADPGQSLGAAAAPAAESEMTATSRTRSDTAPPDTPAAGPAPPAGPASPARVEQVAEKAGSSGEPLSQGIEAEDSHFPSPSALPTNAVTSRPIGVALVEALIEPLEYELTERFWGWRPNDLINVTDNINNLQLGVLETTRRAVVQLAQRISRTGSTDAFDRNLENAMSWVMTKATDYWFPSPETKYRDSLEELKTYRAKLVSGQAYFYTRADNLIPLFEVFEDLLGSCDQNLVKQIDADGSKVGFTKADDYFFYAKGVARAMARILEGVQIDFAKTMENRRSGELLHHAIESCRRAAELDPWIVTDADLDGILANHRANMAAPISHARYYLGQLIVTLAT